MELEGEGYVTATMKFWEGQDEPSVTPMASIGLLMRLLSLLQEIRDVGEVNPSDLLSDDENDEINLTKEIVECSNKLNDRNDQNIADYQVVEVAVIPIEDFNN